MRIRIYKKYEKDKVFNSPNYNTNNIIKYVCGFYPCEQYLNSSFDSNRNEGAVVIHKEEILKLFKDNEDYLVIQLSKPSELSPNDKRLTLFSTNLVDEKILKLEEINKLKEQIKKLEENL